MEEPRGQEALALKPIPLSLEGATVEFEERTVLVSETPRVELRALIGGPQPQTQTQTQQQSQSAPRTIVFVHGFGGWKEQWLPQMRRFAPCARVIALDLRGHGASSKPRSEYSVEELLNDLRAAVDALNVRRPFVLVGHSFGAALVASYAAAHPDEIEKLVLISPASDYSLGVLYRWVFYAPDGLFELGLRVLNAIRPTFKAPVYALKALYFNALRAWDAGRVLPRVRAPALVIRPWLDPLFSRRNVRRVVELLPDAEEVVIPSLSHVLMTARPQAVGDALARFLGLPSRPGAGPSPSPNANAGCP